MWCHHYSASSEKHHVRVLHVVLKHAILKHVSDWHGVPFWKMCISDTRFRLALCKLCHIKDRQHVFLTHCIWIRSTFITWKQTYIQMQLGRTFGLFAQIFMLHDHAFNMRLWYGKVCTVSIWNRFQKCTFFQNDTACQSETCFRMAHASERHATRVCAPGKIGFKAQDLINHQVKDSVNWLNYQLYEGD